MLHSQHGFQLTRNFTLTHDPTLKSSTWSPTLKGLFSSQIEREKLDDPALRNKMSDNILQTSHVMKSFI